MSGMYEGAIQDLIDALGRLPGIGPKSAQRIAFHILQADAEIATALVDSIRTVKERVKFCVECGNVSEEDQCRICRDPRRDNTLICVVEESKDVIAIERSCYLGICLQNMESNTLSRLWTNSWQTT